MLGSTVEEGPETAAKGFAGTGRESDPQAVPKKASSVIRRRAKAEQGACSRRGVRFAHLVGSDS